MQHIQQKKRRKKKETICSSCYNRGGFVSFQSLAPPSPPPPLPPPRLLSLMEQWCHGRLKRRRRWRIVATQLPTDDLIFFCLLHATTFFSSLLLFPSFFCSFVGFLLVYSFVSYLFPPSMSNRIDSANKFIAFLQSYAVTYPFIGLLHRWVNFHWIWSRFSRKPLN